MNDPTGPVNAGHWPACCEGGNSGSNVGVACSLLSERNLRSNPEDTSYRVVIQHSQYYVASAVGHLRNASRHLNLQAPLGVSDPASTDFQASPSEGRTLISIGPPALWCAASHRRGSALLHTPSSAFLHHLYLNAARLALSLAFSLLPSPPP
ncbi:hypothetical protein CSOJ01_03266 [Colletotrichum sojae]|uniref:Uncharacterized protein n=1 Tax=Colletotrichum sojae TaxID=2175907 RepID=A0A8H6JNT4_9PEZI|nr:hypothetical protein CSOJ01_03266 [Colletotrichum sojae]